MHCGEWMARNWGRWAAPDHIWPTNDYAELNHRYRRPASKYGEMIRQLKLSPIAKAQITLRFCNLISKYTDRARGVGRLVGTLRFCILVGGVLVPALVVAGELIEDQCLETPVTPWVTLGVSMVVSLSNGYMEAFTVSAKHRTVLLTLRQLDYEAWSFISLSGRYGKYKRHAQCWRRFAAQVEQINANTTENFALLANDAESGEQSKGVARNTSGPIPGFEIVTESPGGSMTSHSDDDEITSGYVIGVHHPPPPSETSSDVEIQLRPGYGSLTRALSAVDEEGGGLEDG